MNVLLPFCDYYLAFNVHFRNPLDLIEYRNVTVDFLVENDIIIKVYPESVYITDEIFEQGYVPLTISGISPGKSDILTRITPDRLR